MKKSLFIFLFALLYLTSCTQSAGGWSESFENSENEGSQKTEQKDTPTANLTLKNQSSYSITIYKDSLRETVICTISAKEEMSIYNEASETDVVFYITYYITLEDDFEIPYYSDDSYVVVPARKNKIQSVKIFPPDKIKLHNCYIIIENESEREVLLKYYNSELLSLVSNGKIKNQSTIILPEEKGLYVIAPKTFDYISNYSITAINEEISKLSNKIVSFVPGGIYKIIIKKKTNGSLDCVLKSISGTTHVCISYQTNFSSKISNKIIPIGTSLSSVELPTLSRSGYSFAGWYLENNKITNGYLAMENLTLSARWDSYFYSSSNLNQINLSGLESEYVLHIKGTITDSDLDIIASKVKAANKNITLDLKNASGLSEINSKGISEYNSRFSSCYYLKSIILPAGLKKVGNYAFTYCKYLEKVEIPYGTTSIADFAFYQCKNLTSVTIPKTVTSIGYGPFSYCYSLGTINYQGTKAQWNSISKNSWRENAYSCISKVVCSDGVISLN